MVTLYKVHGSENRFILLDQSQLQTKRSIQELVNLIQAIVHSDLPVSNVDGMLVIGSSVHPECLGKMTVINRDGSLASMCGNGLRTVSRYLSERYSQNEFKVETLNQDLHVARRKALADGVSAFGVEISPIKFDASSLPFSKLGHEQIRNTLLLQIDPKLKFTAIAVPNPHLISFVSNLKEQNSNLKRIGEMLNQPNDYFPEGVNVSFAQIINETTLYVKTFERGVGFTNACGTGMSATTLAYLLLRCKTDLLEHEITVYNPGGMVKTIVHQNEDRQYWIELIGNATVTDKIRLSEDQLLDIHSWKIESTGEERDYQTWINQMPNVLD